MPIRLQGVLPILQTPFLDSDEIDPRTLRAEIDWVFSLGAAGVGTGMVTEILRLTYPERLRLTEQIVEATAGRGSVFVGIAAESTRQAIELARHAEQSGCDAVMSVPPMTAKLPPAALVEHFRAIADAISIPVIVQDASAYVGQAIPLSVYQQLLEQYSPEKILFKPEASPIGPNLSLLRDATAGRARIFEGSGGIHLLDSYRRGVAGTMPGLDLLDGIIALWNALGSGNEELAYALYLPICASVALQLQAGLDGFLAIEKHLLVKRGLFPNARRRKPYGWDLDPETAQEVDRLYEQLQTVLRQIGTPH